MHREEHRWYSSRLSRDMNILVYGHYGQPIMVFPTSGGDEREYAGQGMIDAPRATTSRRAREVLLRQLDEQRVLVRQAGAPAAPQLRAGDVRRLHRRTRWRPSSTTTARARASPSPPAARSFGGYHAANTLLKHPHLFRRCLALLGRVRHPRSSWTATTTTTSTSTTPSTTWRACHDPGTSCTCCTSATSGWPPAHGPYEDSGPELPDGRGAARRAASRTPWTTGAPRAAHDWPYWKRQMDQYIARLF